ncbi:MAG TPA: hypothetical protein VD694_07890 [Nitrososphaeraceae archaeon]|nr:hypothetical protein [Nitrososphaeraceae archaeon]
MPQANIKTRSSTFRLDSNTVDNLQREADQKEISLNVLVNQVLRRYVKWDTFEPKIGMMPVPKIILSRCFNKAILAANEVGMNQGEIESHRDEIIESAAEISFGLIRDSALLMKRTYNLWTVLEILQEYMKVSDMKSDHRIEAGNTHVFIIQHELGENWSLFTKVLLNLIFQNLANTRPDVDITTNTIMAKVTL